MVLLGVSPDPGAQLVATDEPIRQSGDGNPVDEQHEKRNVPDVEPIDERRIVPGVYRSDRDIELASEVADHGLHAPTDPAAVGVELHESEFGPGDERVYIGLGFEVYDTVLPTAARIRIAYHAQY